MIKNNKGSIVGNVPAIIISVILVFGVIGIYVESFRMNSEMIGFSRNSMNTKSLIQVFKSDVNSAYNASSSEDNKKLTLNCFGESDVIYTIEDTKLKRNEVAICKAGLDSTLFVSDYECIISVYTGNGFVTEVRAFLDEIKE